MKRTLVIKSLFAAGLYVAVIPSYANYSWMPHPYLGAEYKLSYTQGANDWQQLLPTNRLNNNATLFMGVKLHDFFGGELGFTQSNKNTKNSDVSGFTMFSGVNPRFSKQSVKLSYHSWYADINGQCPVGNSFALLGTIGVAATKPKLAITNLGNSFITTVSGKSKTLCRLGFGVQYTEGIIGVRSRIMWEGTDRLRLNTGNINTIIPYIAQKAFKCTYAWTLGAFIIL